MKSEQRKKEYGEVFTPIELVNQILDKIPINNFEDSSKTFLDPTCGNGNFLVEAKKRLLKYHSEEHILKNMLFGVDILEDNIIECIERLYGPGKIEKVPVKKIPSKYKSNGLIAMFTHNGILVENFAQADGLEYDYRFGRDDKFFSY